MNLVKIGQYLLNRISEIGIKQIFGVPGDYNLEFLDDVIGHKDLEWVGSTNELNAAYAADGYARINGIAAMITAYGVGELSAANGNAGSFSEDVPVIHIVGVPKREVFKRHMIVHHTLGVGDRFDAFKKVFENLTAFTVWLDAKNAINQIDHAIKCAVFYKKPVYIMLPVDVAQFHVSCNQNPISFGSWFDMKEHQQIISDLEKKLNNAKQAVIISGHKVIRYGLVNDLNKFITNNNINVVTTGFGKGSVDETNPMYAGLYYGEKTTDEAIKKMVDTADLILTIGNKFSDITSSNFHLGFDKNNVFEISDTHVKYDDKLFTNHSFGYLVKSLANMKFNYSGLSVFGEPSIEMFVPQENKTLNYDRLFIALNDFIKEDDIVVSDVGTVIYLAQYLNLKKNCQFIMQPLWASIGFSFPAAIGAKFANQNKRVVNIIGDGAFNMTFNEIGTAIWKKINMVVFVLNNKGYTIEKLIHGLEEPYNDIALVDYCKLVKAFDTNNDRSLVFSVTNETELKNAIDVVTNTNDKFILIELHLDKKDYPSIMKGMYPNT